MLCYGNCPALTSCHCRSCETCPAGTYRDGCGGYSSGVCMPCADGMYKEGSGYWHSTCTPCTLCSIDEGTGTRAARIGCNATSRGTCVSLVFAAPTCTGLTADSCATWYEESVENQVRLTVVQPLNSAGGARLDISLERVDGTGVFRDVAAVCSLTGSHLGLPYSPSVILPSSQLPSSIECDYVVASMTPSSAMPVFRLRAIYSGQNAWENATALSNGFIILDRSAYLRRGYRDALMLPSASERLERMKALCRENVTNIASAVAVRRACQCADFSSNGHDCAGLSLNMLPPVRKTTAPADSMTASCDADLTLLQTRRNNQQDEERSNGFSSIAQIVHATAQASEASIVARVRNQVQTSHADALISQYDVTLPRLDALLTTRRTHLSTLMTTRRDMIMQLNQLQRNANAAMSGIFSESGLVSNVRADLHVSRVLAQEQYRDAMNTCAEIARRQAWIQGIFGALKVVAGVVMIAGAALTGGALLPAAIGGASLIFGGIGEIGGATNTPVGNMLDTLGSGASGLMSDWPTVPDDGDRPMVSGGCDALLSQNCAQNAFSGLQNRIDVPSSTLAMANQVASAIDSISEMITHLAVPDSLNCAEAPAFLLEVQRLRREVLMLQQFNLASFQLSLASADMQREGIAAIQGRRLPMVHLSAVKQATSVVGVRPEGIKADSPPHPRSFPLCDSWQLRATGGAFHAGSLRRRYVAH